MFILTPVIAAVFAFGALSTDAAETSGSATVDVMSQYIWRGQQLSEEVVIQPSVGITYEGFGANLWANYDTDLNTSNETDLTLNFTNSIDKFGYDVGYIYYSLEGVDDTQEFYLGVSYDTLLSPGATLYWDFDEGDGAYLVLSVGHSFALSEKLSLDLDASAGVNFSNEILGFDDKGDDFTNFYNGNVSAAMTFPITEHLSITPMIAYSFPLSDDAEDALEAIDVSGDRDADVFYGGVNIALSF
jgi:hypothetical protein